MKHHIIPILLIIILTQSMLTLCAQSLTGTVMEQDEDHKMNPLPGANVYWLETMQGSATDLHGNFEIQRPGKGHSTLVVSYVGYQSDTLPIAADQQHVEVILASVTSLPETVITGWQPDKYISKMNPVATEVITSGELLKAACCNLSESFETNASVDVNYADAVSGAKTIQLLGLSGIYTQMMSENFPNLRGLASAYGLSYVPGPWMESIQVSKGASSVMNGYESITGQINVEYKKPSTSEKFYLNLFGDHMGRVEANANGAVRINDHWSTALFGHYDERFARHDMNHDSFIDQPLVRQFSFFNRWEYQGSKPWHIQLGAKILDEYRLSGQMEYDRDLPHEDQPDVYGIDIETRRYEAFAKIGRVFENRRETSFGFINSFSYHDQQALFGLNGYAGDQLSWHSNFIFSTYIHTPDHKINAGWSVNYDDFDEIYNDSTFRNKELVPGLFTEYTFTVHEKFTLLAGLRADFHSLYGTFFTPRLHMKYHPDEHTTLRISAGRGSRTAHVFAENTSVLGTSRDVIISEPLRQEIAWNVGISVNRHFEIGNRELAVSADFYRTGFVNQVIMDMDRDNHHIYFYNLDGRSYSNSLQIEATINPVDRLDVTVAYRLNDVKATYDGEFLRKPLVNRYKGLLTASYKTRLNKWQFDATAQLNGDSRLNDTQGNPEAYQRPDKSPVYVILNAQVSKFFKKWDLYAGVENLTGFTQKDPIIAADQPFGEYFDASQVWGPIVGRKFYAGVRVKL
ncbi:MAG: TonB-dependent receptor [Bacteroidales bacterium]|nr:TonB-dependent receptor [Lentimicrobiaceae bacterium]MDD5694018.1 TonB-dependent receptor [Bacteroidales bacterium]